MRSRARLRWWVTAAKPHKEKTMPTETKPMPVSLYHRRVALVRDIVRAHSALDEKAATEIAVNVLLAIDTIPEKVR
jgi:hypothetical protein